MDITYRALALQIAQQALTNSGEKYSFDQLTAYADLVYQYITQAQ